jgi:hypothetical protein
MEHRKLAASESNKDYALRGVVALLAAFIAGGAFLYLWYLVSPETLFR